VASQCGDGCVGESEAAKTAFVHHQPTLIVMLAALFNSADKQGAEYLPFLAVEIPQVAQFDENVRRRNQGLNSAIKRFSKSKSSIVYACVRLNLEILCLLVLPIRYKSKRFVSTRIPLTECLLMS
jgi:hypothetical protein